MKQWLLELLNKYRNQPGALLIILQKIQNKFGYIPEDTVPQISKYLKISQSKIFGVASFYSQFKFVKPPKHSIKICTGTSCYLCSGKKILEVLNSSIPTDTQFNLEQITCFGCCALSPVVVIDNKIHSRMTPQKLKNEIKKLRD